MCVQVISINICGNQVVLAEVTVCAALDLGPAARLRMGAASTGATFLV